METQEVEIKINMSKIQMTNLVLNRKVSYVGKDIEQTVRYKHEIHLGIDNQTCWLPYRIGLIWAAFGKLNYVCKRKIFDQYALPVLTYIAERLPLTKNNKQDWYKSESHDALDFEEIRNREQKDR